MHKKILVSAIVLFILSTVVSCGAEASNVAQFSSEAVAVVPYILTDKEMPGMTLTKQSRNRWRVVGDDGLEYIAPGIRQEWTYENGFRIYVNYNALRAKDDIYNNIMKYPFMLRGQLPEGSFSGPIIGDMSWISDATTVCKLILSAKGKYLVLVQTECSQTAKDMNLDGAVLEDILQKILDKVPAAR